MLQLTEKRKQLIPKPNSSYESPFDIRMISNTDSTKTFEVEFDPTSNLIYLTINVEDQSFILTLTANQAVSVGQWLSEAAYVLNFIQKTGIEFQEVEDE